MSQVAYMNTMHYLHTWYEILANDFSIPHIVQQTAGLLIFSSDRPLDVPFAAKTTLGSAKPNFYSSSSPVFKIFIWSRWSDLYYGLNQILRHLRYSKHESEFLDI